MYIKKWSIVLSQIRFHKSKQKPFVVCCAEEIIPRFGEDGSRSSRCCGLALSHGLVLYIGITSCTFPPWTELFKKNDYHYDYDKSSQNCRRVKLAALEKRCLESCTLRCC